MLDFKTQYNLSKGIFLAFRNNSDRRMLSVKDTQKVAERFRFSFGTRYETFTKTNFVILCLFVAFKKSPSSFESFIEQMNSLDFNTDVLAFKDMIMHYKLHLKRDTDLLKEKYGVPSKQQLFQEYRKHNIQFYTLWFYLKYNNMLDDNTNVQQIELNKIKVLLLYVTFSEEGLLIIKDMVNQSSLLLEN